jgi:RNA polymerase sigma-70 factor, ECF subfamily
MKRLDSQALRCHALHPQLGIERSNQQPWCKLMNVQVGQTNARNPYCRGRSQRKSGKAEQNTADKNLHREIEMLIPRLTRYARLLTRDPVAAEDLVQDCLARALGKIHLWEPGTDLRAWLFAILHNQHIGHARREMRQRAHSRSLHRNTEVTLAPPQAAQLEIRDLTRALAKLPEEQRSAILLVGLEGMGYDEAASVSKLPVGTVRSRVSRGRESLRVMTGLFPIRHSQKTQTRATSRQNHFQSVVQARKSASRSYEVVQ